MYHQNSYSQNKYNYRTQSFEQLARTNFIKKVYGLLSIQLLITVAVVALAYAYPSFTKFQRKHQMLLYLNLIITLATVFALSSKTISTQQPLNYILLSIFTLSESYLVAFICVFYETSSVLSCGLLTLSITGGLTFHAFTCKKDYSSLMGAVSGFMAMLFCLAILNWFIRLPGFNLVYNLAFAVIYMVYILIDTQLIMGKKDGKLTLDNYVMGTIILYTDIVGLFLKLLQILGEKKKKQ